MAVEVPEPDAAVDPLAGRRPGDDAVGDRLRVVDPDPERPAGAVGAELRHLSGRRANFRAWE